MKAQRRRHDRRFKAKVALEAIKGIRTIQQIAKEYEVHPGQVADWKKTMQEGLSGVFERGSAGSGEPINLNRLSHGSQPWLRLWLRKLFVPNDVALVARPEQTPVNETAQLLTA